jgi:hypothetical protein
MSGLATGRGLYEHRLQQASAGFRSATSDSGHCCSLARAALPQLAASLLHSRGLHSAFYCMKSHSPFAPAGVFALCLSALAGLTDSASAQTGYTGYEGNAFELSSGKMLYKETHYILTREGQVRERVVLYRCPNNAAFGRKLLRLPSNPLLPDFSFNDARTGHQEGMQEKAGKREISFRLASKKSLKSESIKETAAMVADAGFDEFIRKNWAALKSGKSVPLDFVVPSQLDYLGFKVKFLRTVTLDNKAASVFKLAPSGFLSLFTSGIDVTYLDEDKSLRQFAGLSNIRDLSGENYEVKIDFPLNLRREYPDAAAQQAAATEPLVARCN